MSYDHQNIDPKWQKVWAEQKTFAAIDDSSKPKYYSLVEFPFPSGEGLHVGHPRSYTALDIISRKKRQQGFNVLFPMGWDAFGLPAENYAIKTGTQPAVITQSNIANFRRQLKSIGFSFDWDREVDTTDPAYYKWTQWMFLEFFKAGLAYKAKMAINWCPKDKIGLANEEAVGGVCDRCGGPVEKREKEQWMIAITKYADRLLNDLDKVDYLPKIKKQQIDWIGKSEGAEVDFLLHFANPTDNDRRGPNGERAQLTVFTTRPDTIFGATYLVLAPEHPWVTLAIDDNHDVLVNKAEVKAYVESVKTRTEIDRTNDDKEKTGVELLGVKAINPANGEQIPIYVADYVLPQYGTGAIMAVPAHDERDFAFAEKFHLPIRPVIEPLFAKSTGDDAVRPELEFKKRHAAVCIIKHWSEDKYLCVKYKANTWQGFVIGGIEAGEEVVEGAKREIIEETGYQNVEFLGQLGGIVHAQFYHQVKNCNRWAQFQGLFFQLQNADQLPVAEDEKALADLVWVDRSEVMNFINAPDMKAIWARALESAQTGKFDNYCQSEKGILINSGSFDGRESDEVKTDITSAIGGRIKTQFKLRDWVFSRQRYWGEPIPLVHCQSGCSPETNGWIAIPESDLPLKLPPVDRYEPTDNGESPLSAITDWVNTICPICQGPATRETDTMPNWAGSSWYFLRYIDPHNDTVFADPAKLKYWLPVDLYNGGMEHTTLHLLYSRFWTKFLFDRGHVPVDEPYARRHSHGLILAEDGNKMSKSKGNTVNPDDIVNEFGADTLRVYEVFMGPFEEPVPWSTNGVIGVRRFLDKVIKLTDKIIDQESEVVTKAVHRAIAKVSNDIDSFRFNTAIATLMTTVNTINEAGGISTGSLKLFTTILAPFAPHVANEVWAKIGESELVDQSVWPTADNRWLVDDSITLAVQVNGKLRGNITVPVDASDEAIIALAKAGENVAKYLVDGIKKTIVIKGKIVSFVV